jgi:hypothetical protein
MHGEGRRWAISCCLGRCTTAAGQSAASCSGADVVQRMLYLPGRSKSSMLSL